ncbi:MAG: flippase-like domain-containing protein [Ignavibacterium sp.]|nr:flippase-like domain-containing protein [Ignavibacterium sp.]
MNKKAKTILFIVGLVIFIFLINEFGVENILSNIQKTGWWLLPIIAIWFFVYILNAFAWRLILKIHRDKFSFGEILSILISGFSINYITPVVNLGGEPYKVFALKNKLGTHHAVSSVVLYSMLHFLSSFVFWIIAILLVFFSLSLTSEMKIIFGSAFIIALSGIWFFYSRHKKGIFGGVVKLVPKLPFTKKLVDKLKLKTESLSIIDNQIIGFYSNNKSDFYASLFFEVAARFIASVEFIFILLAIGIEITFQEAIYINAFSSLLLNIFFFVPLGLGIREGSLFFIMSILNFSSGIGIYIGLVNRLRELFWILIGLLLIQLKKSKPAKEGKTEFADLK